MECKNKSDTSNNSGNWNNLKGIQKIPEQHTGKALNQGATEISHIWHCTHTAESSNVAVRTFNVLNNITCSINCNCRTAAAVRTVQT